MTKLNPERRNSRWRRELRAWLRAIRTVLSVVAFLAASVGLAFLVFTLAPSSAGPWINYGAIFLGIVVVVRLLYDEDA